MSENKNEKGKILKLDLSNFENFKKGLSDLLGKVKITIAKEESVNSQSITLQDFGDLEKFRNELLRIEYFLDYNFPVDELFELLKSDFSKCKNYLSENNKLRIESTGSARIQTREN